jgi:hypothetical protein
MNGLLILWKISLFAATLMAGFVSIKSLIHSREMVREKVVVSKDRRNY